MDLEWRNAALNQTGTKWQEMGLNHWLRKRLRAYNYREMVP